MEFSYQLNADDYASASFLAMRKRSIATLISLYVLVALGFLFLALALFLGLALRDWSSAPVLVAVGLFFPALVLTYPYRFRGQFRKSPVHQERKSVIVDDSGVQIQIESGESRTKWTVFSKYAESDKAFVLFQQGNRIFIPISKRELTPGQISELRAIFDAHLKRA
jgi:hypothetical protein